MLWTPSAVRDLERLDRTVARRLHTKVLAAAANPARAFSRLQGSDLHKLRVGDWRVLALLSHETRTVIVQRVGNRENVYDL